VENLEVFQPLTGGSEHDRPAGELPHRQCSSAASVAIQLREGHAGEVDAGQERLCGRDGVLSDHGVEDEQHLVGCGRCADRCGLGHHLLVDAQPAGGVDDDHVVLLTMRVVETVASNPNRVADPVARLGGEHCDTGPLANHLQLGDRVGSL